jgi:hypothetical protein
VRNCDNTVHPTLVKAKHFHTIPFGTSNYAEHLLATDPGYTRPIVVHLNTLDLEDVVSWRWATTPTSTVCPVVPASGVSIS